MDLRLLCADLRAEAAAARAEVQRRQSEFDQVVDERDQSRGRATEAKSRAGALAEPKPQPRSSVPEPEVCPSYSRFSFQLVSSTCVLGLAL
jgi:hypothetical protein